MIPLKIELKNFLSYGEPIQKIDFSDHELICFSGKNGNGKSALLDALTWALWGQARKVSGTIKADAGLLQLGKTQMMVSLEFLCNKNLYRVRREYAKTYGKPYAALDVELFDEEKQKFVTLTDKTIRKTQEKIEKIIGLDFETFVNSAFLRQGLSDEFSQKSPKERKNILASILGLSLYDQLNKRALEKMRSHEDEKKFLVKMQESILLEIEKKKELKEKSKESKQIISDLEKQLKKSEKDITQKEKTQFELAKQKHQLELVEKELQANKQNVSKKQTQLLDILLSWKRVHAKTMRAPSLDVLEKEYKELFKSDTQFRAAQQNYLSLQENVLKAQERYNKQVHEVTVQCEQVLQKKKLEVEKLALQSKQNESVLTQKEKQLSELQNKEKKIKQDHTDLQKELTQFDSFKKEFEFQKNQFEKRRIFYQNMVQRGNWIKSELKEMELKKKTIHSQQSPSCPLCEQVLTIKRKQFLAKQLVVQERFCMRKLDRVSRVLKKLKVLLFEQHESVKKLTFQNERYQQMDVQRKNHEETLQQLSKETNKSSMELEVLRVQVAGAKTLLGIKQKECERAEKEKDVAARENKEIVEAKKQLELLQKQQKELKYDKRAHEELIKKLKKTEQSLKEFESLKQEQSEQKNKRAQVGALCSELKELKKVALQHKTQLESLPDVQKNISTIEKEIKLLKYTEKNVLREKDVAVQNQGKLESELQRIENLQKQQKDREEKMKAIAEHINLYHELAVAFGKNGIQALLIEEAIPEIESEANTLLSQLTDNQSQIFIESLRDLKSGGVRESLDIHISDAAGVRPYEMFSGGEAFRIDFSLRIAISKLLARRAGATLQTLIIDEGFGSQDEEGLQRLMDAIYTIKNDFSKVIVVSHLPALKDSFPVHFLIEKTSVGSVVSIEQRG